MVMPVQWRIERVMRILTSGILSDFKGRVFLQQDSPSSLVPVHHALSVGTTPIDELDRAFRQETGLIVMPVRLTGVFYDGDAPGGELTFCFRCTMRGGDLAVPDGGRPAGFFDYPPLPDGLPPKFRQQVESALRHPGGQPDLENVTGSVGRRLGRLFGRSEPAGEGEQWRVTVRVAEKPPANVVECVVTNADEGRSSTPVSAGESPWAAAERLFGEEHPAVELSRVEIDAIHPTITLVFAPIGK